MTVKPSSAPLAVADLDGALTALRTAGLRITKSRRTIVELLLGASEPLTADALLAGANHRLGAVAPSTVYRVLKVLEEAGLAHHVHQGHGPAVYGTARPAMLATCDRCGALVAVPDALVDLVAAGLAVDTGFVLGHQHFTLTGLCAACASPAPS